MDIDDSRAQITDDTWGDNLGEADWHENDAYVDPQPPEDAHSMWYSDEIDRFYRRHPGAPYPDQLWNQWDSQPESTRRPYEDRAQAALEDYRCAMIDKYCEEGANPADVHINFDEECEPYNYCSEYSLFEATLPENEQGQDFEVTYEKYTAIFCNDDDEDEEEEEENENETGHGNNTVGQEEEEEEEGKKPPPNAAATVDLVGEMVKEADRIHQQNLRLFWNGKGSQMCNDLSATVCEKFKEQIDALRNGTTQKAGNEKDNVSSPHKPVTNDSNDDDEQKDGDGDASAAHEADNNNNRDATQHLTMDDLPSPDVEPRFADAP